MKHLTRRTILAAAPAALAFGGPLRSIRSRPDRCDRLKNHPRARTTQNCSDGRGRALPCQAAEARFLR